MQPFVRRRKKKEKKKEKKKKHETDLYRLIQTKIFPQHQWKTSCGWGWLLLWATSSLSGKEMQLATYSTSLKSKRSDYIFECKAFRFVIIGLDEEGKKKGEGKCLRATLWGEVLTDLKCFTKCFILGEKVLFWGWFYWRFHSYFAPFSPIRGL